MLFSEYILYNYSTYVVAASKELTYILRKYLGKGKERRVAVIPNAITPLFEYIINNTKTIDKRKLRSIILKRQ